ncbi:MAG: glycosyltransferase family 39 protein, partial [candidate division Zixibacteria bacterium]|nr:glycosyltransferase family 39 protein [candidate division Zixibacteria bacterium]
MAMLRKDIIPPVLVFVLFAGLYLTITLVNGSDFLFRPVWDIEHYRTIALRGYEVYPCDPAIHYPMGDICGNVGWFPAWPIILKILSLGQVDFGLIYFPYLFALAGFVLLYRVLLDLADRKAALIGVIALAATPGAFYYLTGFPYAFILFLFGLYLYYFYHPEARGRFYILPIVALIFSLSYPSAFLAAIIPVVSVIYRFRADDSPRRVRE